MNEYDEYQAKKNLLQLPIFCLNKCSIIANSIMPTLHRLVMDQKVLALVK